MSDPFNPVIQKLGDVLTTEENILANEQEVWKRINQQRGPTIAVINASTVVTDADAAKVTAALQIQVSRDLYPAWGFDAKLLFIPKGAVAPSGSWQVAILDDSPQADILGFHDWSKDGLPLAKVFAKTDIDAGSPWSISASHEIAEMGADPDISRCVFREQFGQIVALENSDAPESDQYAYLINGVMVSDFVFPSWFEDFWSPGQTQFDYGKHIDRPFQLLPGGYIGVFDIKGSGGWTQLTHNRESNRKSRAPIGSRRERRRTPRDQWQRSSI